MIHEFVSNFINMLPEDYDYYEARYYHDCVNLLQNKSELCPMISLMQITPSNYFLMEYAF